MSITKEEKLLDAIFGFDFKQPKAEDNQLERVYKLLHNSDLVLEWLEDKADRQNLISISNSDVLDELSIEIRHFNSAVNKLKEHDVLEDGPQAIDRFNFVLDAEASRGFRHHFEGFMSCRDLWLDIRP